MATDHLPLDPTIALLADFAALLGQPQPARSATAYQGTPETHAGARRLAYSEGVATAPKRATANDRARTEAAKWGFSR